MSSSFHVDSVNTHEPAPIHNVVRGECWRNVKPSAELPFTPFWNWEENAQTSARKRVIFAFTSNFHYRRVLSFLYLLTRRAGFVVPPRWFFSFFRLATDTRHCDGNIVVHLLIKMKLKGLFVIG